MIQRIKRWFDWNVNFLWYSQEQADWAGTCYAKDIFGREVEYSEMTSIKGFFVTRPIGNFKGFRFVGFGGYKRKGKIGEAKLKYNFR